MKSNKQFLGITVGLLIFLAIALAWLIRVVFPDLDSTAKAGIVGILVGALASALGGIITSTLGIWERTRDVNEKIRERVSNDALQLTKMDFELRQKSLEFQNRQAYFLAPAKVYRELYKALLEFNEHGVWPQSIEELGLLNIFPLGRDTPTTSSQEENETEMFTSSFYPSSIEAPPDEDE